MVNSYTEMKIFVDFYRVNFHILITLIIVHQITTCIYLFLKKIKNTFFEYRYAKVKTSHFCTSRSFVNTTMHKVDSILNYALYNCMYTCNTDFYNLSILKITSQKKNNWRASVSHRISLPITTTGGAIQNSRYFFVKKYDTLCWTINIIGKTYILWWPVY